MTKQDLEFYGKWGMTPAEHLANRIEPKRENMDGHSFREWRFEVSRAINDIGRDAYLDRGADMVAMFNTNHDPKCAARVWLRMILGK